jgi:hypothetical protein
MRTEHFCTLFDSKFLPSGLCLHESLERHSQPYHLWILCMDETVEKQLRQFALPNVSPIPLRDLEVDRLRAVKGGRTAGEYCWTLTPFLPAFVLAKDPAVERVTYLDADLFFYRSPAELLAEMPEDAHSLITEHAFDPRYEQSATSGRFCVQFTTFRNSAEGKDILGWWQDRCVEWCFARVEDGKFGDQKYLDQWPSLFGKRVHILEAKRLALAPWNVDYYLGRGERPVFFHFHGLRLISEQSVRLFSGYHVGGPGRALYDEYVGALSRAVSRIKGAGYRVPFFSQPFGVMDRLRALRLRLRGRFAEANLL